MNEELTRYKLPLFVQVHDGLGLLDREKPDWHAKVNADTLDMREDNLYVLGQVFGDYYSGCKALGLYSGMYWGFNHTNIPELNRMWKQIVRERQCSTQ